MKIIIDISEDIYKKCQTSEYARKSIYFDLVDAIRRSTPLPKGHWKEHPHEWGDNWQYPRYECSCCNDWAYFDTDYCPNCGADMKGE